MLANAGPLLRRSASDPNPNLPFYSGIVVSIWQTPVIFNNLTEVMIHELGHALGFIGIVLDDFNYLDVNTELYWSTSYQAQYQKISTQRTSIPMQVDSGAHWDEMSLILK